MLQWLAVTIGALAGAYFLGIFTGAHYVPTSDERVQRMLRLAALKPGEKLIDIGSGDGRIVIAAALAGNEAVGYELNPVMVLISRINVRRAGVAGKAKIYWRDFWRYDLSEFAVVTVYGIPHIMGMLEKKLQKELTTGSRVVSNAFQMPTWPSEEEERVFVYRK